MGGCEVKTLRYNVYVHIYIFNLVKVFFIDLINTEYVSVKRKETRARNEFKQSRAAIMKHSSAFSFLASIPNSYWSLPKKKQTNRNKNKSTDAPPGPRRVAPLCVLQR